MKEELEKALNNTANMRDNYGNWIKVGTFIYEDRTYGFIKENMQITVRCIDLSEKDRPNQYNAYPNLKVDWHWMSDKLDDDAWMKLQDSDDPDPYIVDKIA